MVPAVCRRSQAADPRHADRDLLTSDRTWMWRGSIRGRRSLGRWLSAGLVSPGRGAAPVAVSVAVPRRPMPFRRDHRHTLGSSESFAGVRGRGDVLWRRQIFQLSECLSQVCRCGAVVVSRVAMAGPACASHASALGIRSLTPCSQKRRNTGSTLAAARAVRWKR